MTYIKNYFYDFINYMGELWYLFIDVIKSTFTKKLRVHMLLNQIVNIGFKSQLVVMVTGAFTGGVFALQSYFQLTRLSMESSVGSIVSVAMFRELGPVLSGLMISGRIGASMAAEIGTMKVSDQIDALKSMGVHPVHYLVVPRMIAMIISMPLIVIEAVTIGVVAGYFLMVNMYDVSGPWYIYYTKLDTNLEDVSVSLVKGLFFGFLIVFISCHQGFKAQNGAVDVGNRTTKAVVISSFAILICNFFLTIILNIFSPLGE